MMKERTNGEGIYFSLIKGMTSNIEGKSIREKVERLKQIDGLIERIIHYHTESKYRVENETI